MLNRVNPLTFDAHCCHTGTVIKHMLDRVKPSFVISDIPRHSDAQDDLDPRIIPMRSCTYIIMSTVGVKKLTQVSALKRYLR